MMWFLLTTPTSRKQIFCILDAHKHYGCKLWPLQMPELSILLCRNGGWGFASPMNSHPTSWHYKAKWNTAKSRNFEEKDDNLGKQGRCQPTSKLFMRHSHKIWETPNMEVQALEVRVIAAFGNSWEHVLGRKWELSWNTRGFRKRYFKHEFCNRKRSMTGNHVVSTIIRKPC